VAAYHETIERLKAVNGGGKGSDKRGDKRGPVTLQGDDAGGLANLLDSKIG